MILPIIWYLLTIMSRDFFRWSWVGLTDVVQDHRGTKKFGQVWRHQNRKITLDFLSRNDGPWRSQNSPDRGLRVVQTQIILFLKSMSKKDIEWLQIWMTSTSHLQSFHGTIWCFTRMIQEPSVFSWFNGSVDAPSGILVDKIIHVRSIFFGILWIFFVSDFCFFESDKISSVLHHKFTLKLFIKNDRSMSSQLRRF